MHATLSDEQHRAGERDGFFRVDGFASADVLDAMLDAGVNALYSCRVGVCKTCAVKVLDGEADHRDSALSTAERDQDQLMCPCVSRASGECLVLDI